MIFDKKYDDSLWLMMENDKRIGREIVNLFNGFPQELLISIRETLKKYEEYEDKRELLMNTGWYNKNFSGTYQCDNGLLYRYKIEVLGTIEITESFCDENGRTPLRCIIIFPFNRDIINQMDSSEKYSLGMIGSGFSIIDNVLYIPVSVATNIEYKRKQFGSVIDYCGYITNYKHIIHRAKIKNIPEDYSLEDIQVLEKSKKLVRKKKSK